MENKIFEMELKCLFCDCILEGDQEKEYASGDLLKCQECGELNDYDSLVEIAIDEGQAKVAEYAHEEIQKMLKNIFK